MFKRKKKRKKSLQTVSSNAAEEEKEGFSEAKQVGDLGPEQMAAP